VTSVHAPVALLIVGLGVLIAALLIPIATKRAPKRLMRTNVSGSRVPAVLGLPLVVASAVCCLVVAALDYAHWDAASAERATLSILVLVVVGGAAGLIDDLRGDESPRGFRGHLTEAARGRVTGGLIKIALVGGASLVAGLLVGSGRSIIEVAVAIGLSANLFNLLDRAPGRALKVGLVAAVPLVIFAPGAWLVASGGALGAAAVCLPADLTERAMLGDAGSNALGAVLGLGFALASSEIVLLIGIGVLLALNLASEKWSFSEVIARTKPLAAFDSLGRRRRNASK
jgi:UDP-GlcNAc:undecaprenyl-phosphate GlcNAc-1-phosphate transferase